MKEYEERKQKNHILLFCFKYLRERGLVLNYYVRNTCAVENKTGGGHLKAKDEICRVEKEQRHRLCT